MDISNHLNYDLSKIKITPPSTLFELTAQEKIKLLKEKRCFNHLTKLKIDLKGNGRCSKCKFFVRVEVLRKYI